VELQIDESEMGISVIRSSTSPRGKGFVNKQTNWPAGDDFITRRLVETLRELEVAVLRIADRDLFSSAQNGCHDARISATVNHGAKGFSSEAYRIR
jgi:hypothetical protein